MAYLDDDFQGYPVGQTLPFGSFTGTGFQVEIVSEPAGTGIPGTDRSLTIVLGFAEYVRGYLASFTQYLAVFLGDNPNVQPFYSVTNGPNGTGNEFTLLQLRIELDGTLTAICPVTSEVLGNSGDILFPFWTWNFLQVNVTLSDVLVSGVQRVRIVCDIVLNGDTVVSFATTTGVAAAALKNGTSEVNQFELLGGRFGAFTLDTLQAVPSYPHAGAPEALVHQAVVEVDALFDSGELNTFQAVVEVDELPDSGELVVFQMVVEVDLLINNRWYIYEA